MNSESQGGEYVEECTGGSSHFLNSFHIFQESYDNEKVMVLVSVRQKTFMGRDALFNLLKSRRHEGGTTP